jgi:seryl-tRNA synthetase
MAYFIRRSFSLKPRLDYKRICKDYELHRVNAKERKMPCHIDTIKESYEEFCELISRIQNLERSRNELASNRDGARLKEEGIKLKEETASLRKRLTEIETILDEASMCLPNTTHPDSPFGMENKVVELFGPAIDKTKGCIDHLELGKRLNIVDFEAGARVAGSHNYFLRNQGALLEFALIQYALKICLSHGFKLVLPPDMALAKYVPACGFSPRRKDAPLPIYSVFPDEDPDSTRMDRLALVGTAEIPLAAQCADQVLSASDLPLKSVAVGHCFRPETGHHGLESRGLYRVHQFTKVEMFIVCPDDLKASQRHFDEIVQIQKEVLSGLGLSCRVLNMAREELGASAYSKFDIEAWFPGRKDFGEVTSASNCTDFQSRRLNLRYRTSADKRLLFPHTLNGTACAVPRVIQAIIENCQQSDGTIQIPQALHPFMLDDSKMIK